MKGEPKLISLFDLTTTTCRWPFGDAAPYTYCGRTPVTGFPYCKEHKALAYAGTSRRLPDPSKSDETPLVAAQA